MFKSYKKIVLLLFLPLISEGVFEDSKNKWLFTTKIYPLIRKAECNKCKKLCHYDKNDRGGLTCVGVSFTHNPRWFVKNLNKFHSSCAPHAGGKGIYCKRSLLEIEAKKLYYKKYAKKFTKCSNQAFMLIVDSAILEGQRNAIKHIQRSGNLKVDGIFGKNTLKACRNFDAIAFTESRIKRFKRLKQCPIYCKGWIKRAYQQLHLSGSL